MRSLSTVLFALLILLLAPAILYSQEILTNTQIFEMSKAGVNEEIILAKICSSTGNYDVSVNALIDLKKAEVKDKIVAAMLEIVNKTSKQNLRIVEQAKPEAIFKPDVSKTLVQLLGEARTVFFVKHSLYPSLSDLESSIIKRSSWQQFKLTVTRNRDEADLIVEVSHEFLTHYNFRVIDAKTGKVLTASGVTSLGGSLAGNVADKLIKRFQEVAANKTINN